MEIVRQTSAMRRPTPGVGSGAHDRWPDLTDQQRQILDVWVSSTDELTHAEVAARLGCGRSSVTETLRRFGDLIAEGSRRQMVGAVPRIDRAVVDGAAGGDPAMARLAYQRMGLLIDHQQIDTTIRVGIGEHERAQIEAEGGVAALMRRVPELAGEAEEEAVEALPGSTCSGGVSPIAGDRTPEAGRGPQDIVVEGAEEAEEADFGGSGDGDATD